MLLIIEPADNRRARTEQEGRVLYERMQRYTDDLRARGLLTASDSLQSDAAGVRVRMRNGKRMLVDGPFSESKELVGGFFMLTCETRGEAVAVASACPAAEWATVEVRGFGPCYDRDGAQG